MAANARLQHSQMAMEVVVLGCHAEEAAAAGEAFLIATQVDDLWPAVLAALRPHLHSAPSTNPAHPVLDVLPIRRSMRHPDPSDRRGVLIKLSNTGLDLIDRAVVAVTDFESSAVGNAIGSDKERLQLENGLRRMLTAHERP